MSDFVWNARQNGQYPKTAQYYILCPLYDLTRTAIPHEGYIPPKTPKNQSGQSLWLPFFVRDHVNQFAQLEHTIDWRHGIEVNFL